ncbi:MAG TPA: hypothetical protein VHW00_05280 [Thermoanaerobaculia bacterium]|nr:hypothetical protein [Thermoanaerobaculia bacterium]
MLLLAMPARAADRDRIAALNVAGTTLMTYLGCVVQTKVLKKPTGSARCLAAGAIAGAGFYQAKRLAGEGHITTAWIVANLSGSAVENTMLGEHPLSRLGYCFGPFRLRLATPFDREKESLVDVDLNAAETGYLARMLLDADDVDIRDGMLWWETRQPDVQGELVFHGYTWGLYPGVWSGAQKHVWNHEAVHAVQSLQLDSVEPPALDLASDERRSFAVFRIRYVRAGVLNLTDNSVWAQAAYEDRWAEIEAYRFAEDREPPK